MSSGEGIEGSRLSLAPPDQIDHGRLGHDDLPAVSLREKAEIFSKALDQFVSIVMGAGMAIRVMA